MWNKVSDKLPEELESTLCLNEFGGMWVDQFNNGSWCDEQPVYWMPLPAPPNSEDGCTQPTASNSGYVAALQALYEYTKECDSKEFDKLSYELWLCKRINPPKQEEADCT